ncbi:MAG: tetratricopeptide repeat protein [Lachnospiraceae bacterium]|nr:tetratricopeptide repeat protein [Lachnospiraceae bacterium]
MRDENNKIQIPNVDRRYTQRTADTLLASLQADIILLNAGSGYGKTQVLANYVRLCPGKSAWYSISNTDNDLMSFIQNFTNSVQHAIGYFQNEFNVSASLLENIDIVMEQLVIWLDAQIDFLNIILDDFQEITNPDIFNLLDVLIEAMDKKIRLFIVEKRSLPHFFDKYVRDGRAACIGMEELKFTPSEIASILENTIENTGQWANLVYDCTEGWPVGVAQIMIQLGQQRNDATLEIITDICNKLEVSDYFMTRVYKMLPFDIQTFLKRTAVLDYMTAPICNKVAGIHNSESMLRYLVNENLFVQTLGEGSSLYRYHAIFQRFLLSQTTIEEQQDSLRTAACFLLKTNDKIQAAEYACRGEATDIVQAVIEVSGDSMLNEKLYQTMERWFAFLETNNCELTPKSRFIYGKYLMILGHDAEADRQIAQAGKAFYEEGYLRDYKKVLLFCAAAKRKAGELLQAEIYLKQAEQDMETSWNEIAESLCTEYVKVKCCLHQFNDAAQFLASYTGRNVQFHEHTFLSAAQHVLAVLKQLPEHDIHFHSIHLGNIADGFLLKNCLLAEQMKAAYLSGDYQTVQETASDIIQTSEYETLQTSIAWELLAVLSWENGNYRKAVEQARTGDTFLHKNHIWNLELTAKHQQILKEIHSMHRNFADTRFLISSKKESIDSDQKESEKIKIQCMNCFLVFLPDSNGQELKWRTKKAKELFAYLFHLQGHSVSRESLIELLWPDAGMKNAIALFHTTLYSIRQSFMQEGLEDLIFYEKKKYSLNMQLVDSDFQKLTGFLSDRKAWKKDPERILQLYPGSYMGNSGYLWSYGTAKELENNYLAVLRSGAEKRMTQNQPEAAIPFFRRMLEADPYNEEIVSQLILCLYQSGKQSEAKQQYDRMQQLYREDLELDFSKTFKEIVAD